MRFNPAVTRLAVAAAGLHETTDPMVGFICSAPLALVILLRPCIRLLRQRILPSAAMATGGGSIEVAGAVVRVGEGERRGDEGWRLPGTDEDRSLDGELEERVDESIPEHRLFFNIPA